MKNWIVAVVLAFCIGAGTGLGAESQKENPLLSNIRQLIYEGRRSGEGYFSPDGKALIFQSEREPGNPFYQIYILDLETGDSHRVSPGFGKTTCAFFRPGTDEVLFASTHHDPAALTKQKAELEFRASGKQRRYSWDYDEQMDIFVAKRDGTGLRRLTDALGYDAEAAYSSDGQKIVFCSLRAAYPSAQLAAEDQKRLETDPSYFGDIYMMNADGANVRRLTSSPGYDGGPFFSPDGQRIIWRRFDGKGNADVYTMRLDGSDVRRLTDFNSMAWAPYFHPSGDYVIFTSNKLGFSNFELFLVDPLGTREPARVTHTDGFDGLPVFSPDGKRLCWTSNRTSDGVSQLFLADWNDAAARELLARATPRHVPSEPKSASTDAAAVRRAHSEEESQGSPEIREGDLKSQVSYLASDQLEGRLTGTTGLHKAADFIAEQLKAAGVAPVGSNGSYFQSFEFSAGVRLAQQGNQLSIQTDTAEPAKQFELDKDFRPFSFTANGDVEGEVVFAGYGLAAPGKAGEGYDSYSGLNVSNRIVLVLRYVPENISAERKQELNRYAGLRYKAMIARNHGAKAILIVSGPNSPNAGALAPLSSDTSLAGSGIVAASVGTQVAETILRAAGKDLKTMQTALDTENPHAEGSVIVPRLKLKLGTAVERIRQADQNVVGVLPPGGAHGRQTYILIGAHYDHLGRGEMNTLARKEEEGAIHNGADDNASGVAAVLELAAALADDYKKNPETFAHGLMFAFWSGEELGLIGSSHFAEHPPVSLTNLIAYVNFDMVGRLRENKLQLQGVASSTIWRRLIEKRNVAAGFNLALQDDPYLPTDATALYSKGVPVLNFFTGSHDDYHRPSDDSERLNYEGLTRITRFARVLILDLAKDPARPEYVKVEGGNRGGGREALRVYLGTIPDYASDANGLKLSGVRGGSPAEKAGLKAGDVVVEFGGQKIANVYDYTYALEAAKIGQPIQIVVLREGQRLTLQIVPAARN